MGDKEAELIILAGMHRSGTSLLGRVFHTSGLFLGADLGKPGPSNPHGYFEDIELQRFHDAVLARHGLDWQVDEPFRPDLNTEESRTLDALVRTRRRDHSVFGFKDPRVCFFLDAWKSAVPSARVVMVYRDFGDVAWSLERRHGRHLATASNAFTPEVHRRFFTRPDHALRLWYAHNRVLLDFAEQHPEDVILISFSRLSCGASVVQEVRERWGVRLDDVCHTDVYNGAIVGSRSGLLPVADSGLAGRVFGLWEALEDHSMPLQPGESTIAEPTEVEIVDEVTWLERMQDQLRAWEAEEKGSAALAVGE